MLKGNIGVGKTTLLAALREQLPKEDLLYHFTILSEPLREWTNVSSTSLLAAFYRDPKRWAFALNVHILNTSIERKHTARKEGKPYCSMNEPEDQQSTSSCRILILALI